MDVPETVRELRPHFIFKISEVATGHLWEIGGGAVMAALVAFIGKLRSDLDYVSVLCVFFFGALLMYLSIRVQGRRAAKSPDSTHGPSIVDTLAEPKERPIEEQRNAGPDAEPAEAVLRVQTMNADPPATSKDITFKNKIRMNITNNIGKDIYILVPLWESSLVQVQADPPARVFAWKGAEAAGKGTSGYKRKIKNNQARTAIGNMHA